ncbi:hypothetical protein V8C34DRAFT_272811, partial [Trichoderma compactum]
MDDFQYWSVAYDGRVCMVIGKMPPDDLPGIWSRSDLRKAWGATATDKVLNMVRAEMDCPWMEKR